MRSVTDQVLGDGALDRIIDEGGTPNEDAVRPEPVEPVRRFTDEQRVQIADAKLRVAFATSDRTHAAKPAGVVFVTPGRNQRQEIFDDGSVRNPYKKLRKLSGRQRRLMRKDANRAMRAQGIPSRIEDALKGIQRPQPAPQQETETQTQEVK